MPETPTSEFWKTLKPIENSQKPDALPEVYLSKVATDDDRYYVPFSETVGSRPLWINVKDDSWAAAAQVSANSPARRTSPGCSAPTSATPRARPGHSESYGSRRWMRSSHPIDGRISSAPTPSTINMTRSTSGPAAACR